MWWFGEGLGGVLSGGGEPGQRRPRRGDHLRAGGRPALARRPDRGLRSAGPVRGGPGGWGHGGPGAVAGALGQPGLLRADSRQPGAAGAARLDRGHGGGEPGWLAALGRHSAALVAQQGLAASIALAVALIIVAVGVYLPPRLARATLILGIVVAAVIWVVGEAFGEILTGGATDPNSGPPLALLALAYWPVAAAAVPRAGRLLADERRGGISLNAEGISA